MNRGSASSGRAAATAGLNRSVWPTASGDAGRGGRGDQLVGLGERSRHRLLDEDRHARLEKRQRDVAMQLGRHRNRHGVDLAEQLARVEQRPRAAGGRDLLGARAVGVDDRDELDARQRRQNPRVMLARGDPTPTTAIAQAS